jgi:hypothetical protein
MSLPVSKPVPMEYGWVHPCDLDMIDFDRVRKVFKFHKILFTATVDITRTGQALVIGISWEYPANLELWKKQFIQRTLVHSDTA